MIVLFIGYRRYFYYKKKYSMTLLIGQGKPSYSKDEEDDLIIRKIMALL